MTDADILPGEEKYAQAIRKVLTDTAVQQQLENDPIGTLEGLGFDLSDEARRELESGPVDLQTGIAAVPAVIVRVATNGTRPAVSVVVHTTTVSATRGPARELQQRGPESSGK